MERNAKDPRIAALPDIHGHAKGEHKPYAEERPIPYTARMLFLWFFHACRRSSPRFIMVSDHMNYLTFEDPAAVNLVRRALKLAQAGDLYGAAETAGVELGHAAVVSEGLRKGMRYSIGAEVDNDPRCRPDAQNIVDAMKPDGMVRSVHFIPIKHPQHGENWLWPFDNPEFKDLYEIVGTQNVWEIYMATLLDAIEKLPGNIIGHFYVPAKFGHWPDEATLETYEDRFVDACAERGMAIEVNSRYFYKYFLHDEAELEKYRAAHLRLLRKAKAKGVMVAVGSDAHSPKDQGGAFDAVLALLDAADINEIAFPINGRLARVALRATEEILRQHSAALAPAVPERAPLPRPIAAEATPGEERPERDPVPVAAGSVPLAGAPATPSSADGADTTNGVARPVRPRPKRKPAAERAEPIVAHSSTNGSEASTATTSVADGTPAAPPPKRSHKKIVRPTTGAAVLATPPAEPAQSVEPPVAASPESAPVPDIAPPEPPHGESDPTPVVKTRKQRAAEAPRKPPAAAPKPDAIPVRKHAPDAEKPAAKAARKPGETTVSKAAAAKARPPKAVPVKADSVKATSVKTKPEKATGKKGPGKVAAARLVAKLPVAKRSSKAALNAVKSGKPAAKAAPKSSASKPAAKKPVAKKPAAKKTAAKPAARHPDRGAKPAAKKSATAKAPPGKRTSAKPASKNNGAKKSAAKKVAKRSSRR